MSSNISVISSYIKRFREQAPLPPEQRPKVGSKKEFWWQSPDADNDGNMQSTDSARFSDLSLSRIITKQSLSSLHPSFDDPYQSSLLSSTDTLRKLDIRDRTEAVLKTCESIIKEYGVIESDSGSVSDSLSSVLSSSSCSTTSSILSAPLDGRHGKTKVSNEIEISKQTEPVKKRNVEMLDNNLTLCCPKSQKDKAEIVDYSVPLESCAQPDIEAAVSSVEHTQSNVQNSLSITKDLVVNEKEDDAGSVFMYLSPFTSVNSSVNISSPNPIRTKWVSHIAPPDEHMLHFKNDLTLPHLGLPEEECSNKDQENVAIPVVGLCASVPVSGAPEKGVSSTAIERHTDSQAQSTVDGDGDAPVSYGSMKSLSSSSFTSNTPLPVVVDSLLVEPFKQDAVVSQLWQELCEVRRKLAVQQS
jgi:hypothetical protein